MRFLSVCACSVALIGLMSSATAEEKKSDQKTEKVSVFSGKLTVPAEFKRVEPKSRILEHEFQAKAGEGDDAKTARLTMMAAGGDVAANIQRWKGQFAGGDPAKQKSEKIEMGNNWIVHLVDVSGSFAERVGGGPFAGGKVVNRPDYAMAGAILVNPTGGKYFLKLIGPASVVKANREAFVKMVKSLE